MYSYSITKWYCLSHKINRTRLMIYVRVAVQHIKNRSVKLPALMINMQFSLVVVWCTAHIWYRHYVYHYSSWKHWYFYFRTSKCSSNFYLNQRIMCIQQHFLNLFLTRCLFLSLTQNTQHSRCPNTHQRHTHTHTAGEKKKKEKN